MNHIKRSNFIDFAHFFYDQTKTSIFEPFVFEKLMKHLVSTRKYPLNNTGYESLYVDFCKELRYRCIHFKDFYGWGRLIPDEALQLPKSVIPIIIHSDYSLYKIGNKILFCYYSYKNRYMTYQVLPDNDDYQYRTKSYWRTEGLELLDDPKTPKFESYDDYIDQVNSCINNLLEVGNLHD